VKKKEPLCATCAPIRSEAFCHLAQEHLERLDREKVVRLYRRGQTVFEQGDEPAFFHCIYSGCIKLFKMGSHGEEQVIRLLGGGDFMGFRAILAEENYAATAAAVEPSTLCCIPASTFLSLLGECPALSLYIMRTLARELRISEDQMLVRTQESVRQRTARFLLWAHERLGKAQDPSRPLALPVKRNEMAQVIVTSPETLSRTLRAFSEKGVIRLTRTEISITNLALLRNIAGGPARRT
jgi:CRP/FNR family transcriptional regulator